MAATTATTRGAGYAHAGPRQQCLLQVKRRMVGPCHAWRHVKGWPCSPHQAHHGPVQLTLSFRQWPCTHRSVAAFRGPALLACASRSSTPILPHVYLTKFDYNRPRRQLQPAHTCCSPCCHTCAPPSGVPVVYGSPSEGHNTPNLLPGTLALGNFPPAGSSFPSMGQPRAAHPRRFAAWVTAPVGDGRWAGGWAMGRWAPAVCHACTQPYAGTCCCRTEPRNRNTGAGRNET